MFIKSSQIGLMGFFLFFFNDTATPEIYPLSLHDALPISIKGADVRIESRDGKQIFNTVKTDTQGRYISQGLQPGVYRVSLVVNGAVKAAIGNMKTKSDQATQLNFDLKPVATGQASTEQKKGKHMVWMPPSTGSHTGGRWVEVPDGAVEPGALNVKRATAEELKRAGRNMSNQNGGN